MAAGDWTPYNDFKKNLTQKLIDLDTDTIKVALVTSSSNGIAATLTPASYANLTNEVANGNGYTTGGATAASPTVTGGGATATITFDTNAVSWTASGGTITARAAIMYSSTAGLLIAYCLLDDTPADVVVPDGDTLQINIADVFSMA